MDGGLQVVGFGFKVLYCKSPLNGWSNQKGEYTVGRILEALCYAKPKQLGVVAGYETILL